MVLSSPPTLRPVHYHVVSVCFFARLSHPYLFHRHIAISGRPCILRSFTDIPPIMIGFWSCIYLAFSLLLSLEPLPLPVSASLFLSLLIHPRIYVFTPEDEFTPACLPILPATTCSQPLCILYTSPELTPMRYLINLCIYMRRNQTKNYKTFTVGGGKDKE
jgi:hypothetical protein